MKIATSELDIMESDDIDAIYHTLNDTTRPFSSEMLLHENLELQTYKSPHAIALVYGYENITYSELNIRSNQMAFHLREKGVSRDTICPIIANRSIEMIVSIFAVLKAGGAYLPIAPTDPNDRVKSICYDCNAQIILTTVKDHNELFPGLNMIFTGDLLKFEQYSTHKLPKINKASDLAYVIYTSGSTGKPKGVMIEHNAIINRLQWMQNKFPITSSDVLLQKTSICFDVSVWELFWWSFVGAKLCILQPNEEKFPPALIDTILTKEATVIHFVPSMFNVFLGYLKTQTVVLNSLTKVFCSGEALLSSMVNGCNEYLNKSGNVQLINLYGPTEATVDVSWFICPDKMEGNVPIGKPIQNIKFWIVKNNQLMGKGENQQGELCISGVGLARGYINRVELTHNKFTKHPVHKGLRIYKTGDINYIQEDGNVAYNGRMDNQVKIRGLRIELGEIEAVISTHPNIIDTCVIVKKFSESVILLIAYIVADVEIGSNDLKQFIGRKLPKYMVPNKIVYLDKIDLTASGKKDRKKLMQLV